MTSSFLSFSLAHPSCYSPTCSLFSLLSLFSPSSLSRYRSHPFSTGRDRDISGQFYGRGAQHWHSLVHTQSSPSSKIGMVVIVNFITSVLLLEIIPFRKNYLKMSPMCPGAATDGVRGKWVGRVESEHNHNQPHLQWRYYRLVIMVKLETWKWSW